MAFNSVSFTQGYQFIPIKVVLEGPLAEVGVHSPSFKPKINSRAEVPREAPERHTQELAIFREEALVINDSTANDVLFFEGWTVGFKINVTDFLAAASRVTIGVLSPARQPKKHRPTFEFGTLKRIAS